jgi:alkylresorcinol/alkylpyrone synthase
MSRDVPPPVLRAVGRALPPHRVEQEEITRTLERLWSERGPAVRRLRDLHRGCQVHSRHIALPIEQTLELGSFAAHNDRWQLAATELGAQAVTDALARAGLQAADIDQFLFITTTGISTPSIDALIADRLERRADVERTPIFGLGCAGGVAGVARAASMLAGLPDQVAVVLAVELCSLTFQRDDLSVANLVATGLFGDGAAAAVITGARRADGAAPRIVASRARRYPGTQTVMGWKVTDDGFQVRLSADVPRLIGNHLGDDVDAFLAAHRLTRADIRHWIAHTGGPRVLEAVQAALDLPRGALLRSWQSLGAVGNLSSAAALFVLADHMDGSAIAPGDLGLLMAMGPGFSAELVLLAW